MFLAYLDTVWRTVEGAISAVLLIAIVSFFGWSPTIDQLLADHSLTSILFLVVVTILLADLIAKMIGILGKAFPDLIPRLKDKDFQLATLLQENTIGKAIMVLTGAQFGRVIIFLVIFTALGWSYAGAPDAAQDQLVGELSGWQATGAFILEGIAGAVGYFLFFLGPENISPIKGFFATETLTSGGIDGDIFLSAIRLYGLAFVFAILRALVTPIVFLRARLRAMKILPEAAEAEPAPLTVSEMRAGWKSRYGRTRRTLPQN